jgi:hypothetical protein
MDYIVTTYFTSEKDPQRSDIWANDDFSIIKDFYESVIKHNLNCIILIDNSTDEFIKKYKTNKIEFVRCDSSGLNMVDIRWKLYNKILNERKEIKRAFFLDVSDVIILKNPFGYIVPDKIYCGDEENINIKNDWMNHRYALLKNPEVNEKMINYLNKKILNAGILGGERNYLIGITKKMAEMLDSSKITHTTVDMCVINHVLYTYTKKDMLIHGSPVNTVFRKNEINNEVAWFKHK